ncbi:MAG: tryptophan synthase subunit alpha [Bdellovibrionota bacterium]
MQILLDQLEKIKQRPKSAPPALMTHVVLGYPNMKASIEIVRAMADGGASLIELQIPFSDPMADGPTIMAANEASLENGTRVRDCFKAAEKLSRDISVPLLFMSYFNLLYCYPGSVKRFCRDAAQAGVQGLIVPDVPPEETSEGYYEHAYVSKVVPVPVVAPVSTKARLTAIQKVAPKGFVYCVSTTGTTGARSELPAGLPAYLKSVKSVFKLPVAVGFGISTPKQVASLRGVAEIAVVGSAMIDRIKQSPPKRLGSEVKLFTRALLGLANSK